MTRLSLAALFLGACGTIPISLPDGGGLCIPGPDGRGLRALGREIVGPPFRPDEAVREGSPSVLWVTGAHDIGRLSLFFSGTPVSSTLPLLTDGGCNATGQFAFLIPVAPDAGTVMTNGEAVGSANLEVTEVDGGTRFRVTNIVVLRPDGGTRLAADRDLTVVVPP